MRKMNRFLFAFILVFSAFSALANEAFENWKHDFYHYALDNQVSKQVLDNYFVPAVYLTKVVEKDKKQPEFTQPFGAYMQNMVSETRVETGKIMFKRYNRILGRMERLYGIPAHYLLAFWGLETNFGKTKGNTNVLDALATLSFDARRSAFFSEQLLVLLKILQEEGINPPKGSWAGAFGHFQFIPTTFYQYAVDEDGDGRRDIIYSFDDAISSAANYLKKMGWNEKQRWGRQVVLAYPEVVASSENYYPISYWNKKGILRADGKNFQPEDLNIKAKLLLPEGVNGPAFLVYQNFDVIKRWNNSDLYALAVGILADKIINRQTLSVENLKVLPSLSYQDVIAAQQSLKILGFYNDKIDGMIGKLTKTAIKDFQKAHRLPQDGFLSQDLLKRLRKDIE